MKKKTPPKHTKKDFERVYENPLDWCPLLGYIPDQIDAKLKEQPVTVDTFGHGDTLSAYDLAHDYIDNIIEARTYWNFDESHYNIFQYERIPNIKTADEKNKIEAARWLFKILYRIAHSDRNYYDELINQWTPFISMRTWKQHKSGVLEIPPEALLNRAQHEQGFAGDVLGFNYELYAYEICAMFALHETWIMLIRLLKNEFTPNDEDIIFDSGTYVEMFLYGAATQRNLRIYSRNSNKYKTDKEAQRERGKKNLKPRRSLEGVKLTVNKLMNELKNNSAERLFEYLFRHHRIDNDLVKGLLDGEEYHNKKEVKKYFYEIAAGRKVFHIGILPDETNPKQHLSATLIQIEDENIKSKPLTFSGFREYRYPRKQNK